MRPPLLVHLVFHPASPDAAALARLIHRELNGDPLVPGLRLPTTFSPSNDGQPPAGLDLDQAEQSFVVVLADTKLDVDEAWCSFVADVWTECSTSVHRCMPVQLNETAWPLDRALRGASFVRAFEQPDDARSSFVVRRVVTELARFLHGDSASEDDSAAAPTTVFISHTKMDLAAEPRVVESLKAFLGPDQPIKTWFDTGDIEGGSEFARRIAAGVEDSSLLCVLTDHYGSREWCRKEVLLAKRGQRPIVVVDALTSHEIRSFPYLGNLPVLRWNGDPQVVIDLLLKETLRSLHTLVSLEQSRRDGDVLFTRPPELLTIGDYPAGTTIVYPDPSLGVEETETLMKHHIEVTTPLQQASRDTSLIGVRIALSMSESGDIARFGFGDDHLSSTILELSRHLLIKGATLVYGGHLGDDGYTLQLAELVRKHNALPGVDEVERLENFVGWPWPLDDVLISRYKEVAKLIRVPRPADVSEKLSPDLVADPAAYFSADSSAEHRYAWTRGMTEMRKAQTASVSARIVLGGSIGPTVKVAGDGSRQLSWYAGRIPGVLEEVLLSAQANQPVFLLGAFGGVPALVMDLIDGRDRDDMTWDFHSDAPFSREMRARYETEGEGWWDYPAMTEFVTDRGLTGLNPLLSEQEHRELVRARHVQSMLGPLMSGLARLAQSQSSV